MDKSTKFSIGDWCVADSRARKRLIQTARSELLLMIAVTPEVLFDNRTTQALQRAAIRELGRRLDLVSGLLADQR